MLRPRVIPCLLLKDKGLVKGIHFKNHRYVGDPINAVRIFKAEDAPIMDPCDQEDTIGHVPIESLMKVLFNK